MAAIVTMVAFVGAVNAAIFIDGQMAGAAKPMRSLFAGLTGGLVGAGLMALGIARLPASPRQAAAWMPMLVTGAVSVPFYDPAPYFDSLPKDTWLVCYCACPHAESGQLAQKLAAQGFKKVTVLDEGLNVWKSKNYPVTTAQTP